MQQIVINKGMYRNSPVIDKTFELIKGPYPASKKGFTGYAVTVRNTMNYPEYSDVVRVLLDATTDVTIDALAVNTESAATTQPSVESDEKAISRIRERFEILQEMSAACIGGDIKALIVSGPPGVGKSYSVEQEIDKICLLDTIASRPLRSIMIKGSASALGLYQILYKYSASDCSVVFDDCDAVLFDDVALNLLKGALDSGKKRTISWLSESQALRREGIPNSFDFKGSVIFITNIKFDGIRSHRLKEHLNALQSRCHYLDLTMDSERDKYLRIKQIANDGVLFSTYDFDDVTCNEILEFMAQNQNQLREMSLRMALKIADLRKYSPENWMKLAEATCLAPV